MYDIVFINLAVHGGSYHKLIHASELLNEQGIRSIALFSCEAPLGLQEGIDFDSKTKTFFDGRVLFYTHAEIINFVKKTKSKLFIFDFTKSSLIKKLIKLAKKNINTITIQIGFHFDDLYYWGSDYVFLPHPLTLWFIMECRKQGDYLKYAKGIFFIGNLLAEPICNEWTSSIRDKGSLFRKYNLDPDLPTCLFLPNRIDGNSIRFGQIIKAIKKASMNMLIKLHPWEYKSIKHGFCEIYGKNKTSVDRWNVSAIEEKDSSWATLYSDLVIVSGSTVGLEMPFWQKPLICFSERNWKTILLKDASIRVNNKYSLTRVLKKNKWKSLNSSHFKKGIEAVHPYDLAPKGALQTFVDKIKLLLTSEKITHEKQKEIDIKSLYSEYTYRTRGWVGAHINKASLNHQIWKLSFYMINGGLKEKVSKKLRVFLNNKE
ncbi:hypothetical protein GMMP1_580012 [Candidatus Magnetomoraceae bacterium gMMP-1]